jgi:GNAT superfamily N-acetyltransferase
VTDTAGSPGSIDVSFRHATVDDLPVCGQIWRASITDYVVPLGQQPIPDELGPITRLYEHLHATDPERFVVAVTPDAGMPGGERVTGFALAVVREHVWFLSMLFVLPDTQARGIGRALLDRVLPSEVDGMVRATGTDSAQPISNALYATYGLVPRMQLLNLVGLPRRPDAFAPLPSGIVPVAFDELAAGPEGHADLVRTVDALDREIAGFAHPADHRYLRIDSRRGWLYRGPDGTALGYGYAGEAGRIGPIAVRDPELLGPIIGHLSSAVTPRGAFSMWLPGLADQAVVPALRAGFRLEPFPVLLCWDRPMIDLTRYIPISPGLL